MGDIEGRSNTIFPRLPPAENILCTALIDTYCSQQTSAFFDSTIATKKGDQKYDHACPNHDICWHG